MHKIADTSGQDEVITPVKSKKKLILALAAAGLLVAGSVAVMPALSQWSSADHTVSAERLRIAAVERGDFSRDISVQARVVAAVRPVLYSPAQGTVTFLVDAGDTVEKDQLLATIDSPELQSEFRQEKANLTRLESLLDRQKIDAKSQTLAKQKDVDKAMVTLNAAQREKRRADNAFSQSLISDIDFQKAKDDLQNAELEHAHVLKEIDLLNESLAFEVKTRQQEVNSQRLKVSELERQVLALEIRSPVTGLVGNREVEQKNTVAKNQALLNVVDLSQFELELDVPESYADDLALGMKSEILFNGEAFYGSLVAIAPEIINNQVSAKVRFDEVTPQGLRQNQRLTTRVLLEQKTDVLYLPRGQFLDSYSGRYAYVVRDGMAYRTSITTGARSLSKVEVAGGLKLGDRVIISNTESFNNAERVALTQ